MKDSPHNKLFWPIFISSLGFCLLVSLGVWQLKRLTWKQDLIIHLHHQQALPPADVLSLVNSTGSNPAAFRRVYATGSFQYDLELHLLGRTLDHRLGYDVFTPLILADQRIIYVNRGWVPHLFPSDQILSNPSGNVRVEGVLREGMKRTYFTPPNHYPSGEIFTFDPSEIADRKKGLSLIPFYIDASEISQQGNYPQLRPQEITLRNNHLLYACTWFVLAGILAIICFIFINLTSSNHKSKTIDRYGKDRY